MYRPTSLALIDVFRLPPKFETVRIFYEFRLHHLANSHQPTRNARRPLGSIRTLSTCFLACFYSFREKSLHDDCRCDWRYNNDYLLCSAEHCLFA